MLDFKIIDNLSTIGKEKNKKQIILTHTSRNVNDYITSLSSRHNGKFDKIPNYIIGIDGVIYKTMSDTSYSNYINDLKVNRCSIIISFENFGWLEKIPLTDSYVNWIADIYKGSVVTKKWRDKLIWHPYSDIQIETCLKLCNLLIDKFHINRKCIGHNTKIDGLENYGGIISYSNINSKNTAINPTLNFENFKKEIEKNDKFI